MFKSILIGIDASEQSKHAQALGCHLARRLRARILGLHVVNARALEPPLPDDISENGEFEPYLESLPTREQLTQAGRQMLASFTELATREGLSADTALEFGLVGDCISEHSRSADLTLMGRSAGNGAIPALGQATDIVVRKSPNTVLICPGPAGEIRHLALAYDGSERAAKAMHSAAALASDLGARISVITVARDPKVATRYLDEARAYLATYGLEAACYPLSGPPGQRIVEFTDREADGVFLGAHGHSRIVEMVLGSTTEYVLRNSHRMLFLCH